MYYKINNNDCIYFYIILMLFVCSSVNVFSQSKTQKESITASYSRSKITKHTSELKEEYKKSRNEILRLAKLNGWVLSKTLPNGNLIELQEIGSDSTPLYYTTFNDDINEATKASSLYSGGILDLNINGEGMEVGVWDGGIALQEHQEFGKRVSIADENSTIDKHSTLVMGVLIASGEKKKAKGVAYKATAITSDWKRDKIEVADAAANGLLLSNHSYGINTNRVPDWYFGSYIKVSQDWDKIMYNAPYYLMVTASGNAQNLKDNDSPIHGVNADGFDLILGFAASKNAMTVAAAEPELDRKNNLINATVANYSSFGPMDDGRIKPDISSLGTGIYTTSSTGVENYESSTGTSMATPGVTGSMLLLQQYYEKLNNKYMKAATLKGLVLHTADDVQQPGPDYKLGWGVINSLVAAETIKNKDYRTIISEEDLANNEVYTVKVNALKGETLMASISWTDPATGFVNRGTLNDITPALVNDLDIRITKDQETYYPWKLNAANAYMSATKGDNNVDPFEKIQIDNAEGEYIISISHKGSLATASQSFSLIVSGVKATPCNIDIPVDISILEVDENNLVIGWDEVPETLFEVQYRKKNTETWTTEYTNEYFIPLSKLELNNTYEIRLKSICTTNVASEYSTIKTFVFKGEETELLDIEGYETLSTNPEIKVIVYPNPAVEEINLTGNISKEATYSIITSAGITVKKGSAAEEKIKVNDISKGLYILTVEDLSGISSIKFYID